jgi:hypothetical protein
VVVSNQSTDTVDEMERFSAALANQVATGEGPLRHEPLDFWRREAAGNAKRWRRRHTDDEIPALRRGSIRLEPFVIQRR